MAKDQRPDPWSQLDAPTRALLTEHAGGELGHLWILRPREAYREAAEPLWLDPASHGLVLFGSAPNGDVWAIDLQDQESVVVLGHDPIWDGDVSSAREGMVRVADDLSEALRRAAAGTLPIDYWAAREGRF